MLFRLGAALAIGWMIHAHHVRATAEGDRPILASEVRDFLPETHTLSVDTITSRGGFHVLNRERSKIGYVVRTMPQSRDIKGYSGPSDVLMVFDPQDSLAGIAIRHSYDTPSHVEDVSKDYLFMERWNGQSWSELAKQEKVFGVSGATRTSEAVANSVFLRAALAEGLDQGGSPTFHFRWQDAALILTATAGMLLAFWRTPKIQRRKTWIHAAIVIYLGLISGDLLAQSLLSSWMEHGIPWKTLPGLVFLAAIAFLIPWATGRPVYCTHICPHGHLQRWLMKLVPARRKLRLHLDIQWGLLALPGLLLALVLTVVFLKIPIDLAGIEPFDAWALRGAGIATIIIAIVSLLFAAVVPMGFCRFGCPTGLLLNLGQKYKHGFHRRDGWLLGLLGLACFYYFGYEIWKPWLML
ncbi:MAG: 4Fe-4S binding protein [Verrucomicrobiota bacterium]